MPVNKIFPAINLVFTLAIILLVTLSVRNWTHPPYPSKVDGSRWVGSPKNPQKLEVRKPGYSAGTLSQVVQNNIFRRERRQYITPPPPPSTRPTQTAKPALPPPNLVLKGVLMLGGTKIAILQGKYSIREGGRVTQKDVKKKGYSIGQIVGGFELIEIEKNSATLDDKKGRKVLLRLAKRAPDKVVHRKGNSLFHKNKKYNPSRFKATPVKNQPTRSKVVQPKPMSAAPNPAPAQNFRISGAASPPPPQVHISGR